MHSLLHVSVHLDHPQGAYADPCLSYTFVKLSVKYIVKSFAVLWQHVFQAVVCIECILLIILQKCNLSKDQHRLPEDGPDGPKHVGANV
jgi:hypothetical protein